MTSSARHLLDPVEDRPPSSYTGPITVHSRDFDAVAPMRHPERYEPPVVTREPSGDGPEQVEDSAGAALLPEHSLRP